MGQSATEQYHARMQRVLEHIDQHLDDDLSVDVLAGVAAFSRFHFQRQFSALFGVSVARYVQLQRLRRASQRLAYQEREPVLQIALDSGYEGPEAFARAFRQHFAQSPSEFRRNPQWDSWHAIFAPLNQARRDHMSPTYQESDVRIVDFPATPIAVMEYRGDHRQMGDAIRRFVAWRRANEMPPARHATFNRFYVDPDEVPAEDYRVDLCVALGGRDLKPNDEGITQSEIPAGECAVIRQTGTPDDLSASISYIFGEWLPESGRELRDCPVFVQRVRFFPEVPEHESISDIYLPLK
jgi:AraC family transcriptional regulator